MSDDTVPSRPRRRILRRVLLGFALLLIVVALVFAISPTPGALLVRAVFERTAHRLTTDLEVGAPDVTVLSAVPYREGDPDALLDVYTPAGTTGALPTIVWTHGGAWLSGNRTNYAGYYRRLADAGFTVVSLGYSLAPEHRYPTPVHQLNDAHAYLLEHADELYIDTDRLVLAGDSAGAQLSAQLAAAITSPDYARRIGLEPALDADVLRGVVLHCGIYDVPAMGGSGGLVGWGVKQALWAYTGDRNFTDSEAAQNMSTLTAVTSQFPPAFVGGGNADPLTDTQSRPLADALTDLGVPVDTLFYPDGHEPELGHEYQFDLSLADARTTLDRSVDFVRKVTG